jgi:predicted dehydrogenase
MGKLVCILVGCGRIGSRHAAIIHAHECLAAVCDIDEEKAKQLADTYQVPYFTDLNSMLAEIKNADMLAVCTPNGLHASHTILGLQSKLQVVCEKPMAIASSDALQMIEAASLANKKLFVVKQNRLNPPVVFLKKLLDEHRLGNIYSVQLTCCWNRGDAYYENSWHGTKQMDGGTLFTQFSHFIDLLFWMFGDVAKVKAFCNNSAHQHCIEFEDNGVVALQFNNGILGAVHFTVNNYHNNLEGSLLVIGEKGTVKIGGQYLNELSHCEVEGISTPQLPKGNPANQYGNYEGSMSNHEAYYKEVWQSIRETADRSTNSFEAFKTVEIIERIYQASQQ